MGDLLWRSLTVALLAAALSWGLSSDGTFGGASGGSSETGRPPSHAVPGGGAAAFDAGAAARLGLAPAEWEVATPRVRVLYTSVDLEAYARRVAATADAVWLALGERFALTPRPLTITLDDDTDVFNAIATVEPRRGTALRAVFPVAAEVGRDAADPLRLLLVHELAHVVQLDYDRLARDPGEAGGLRLGLVGERIAASVPMWFLEGFATWLESDVGPGGRLASARTIGMLRALALETDAWPALDDVALSTFDGWPGGEARYLMGAQMVDAMVARHGEDALRRLLAGLADGAPVASFSVAWQASGGDDLETIWDGVRARFAGEGAEAARIAAAWAAAASPSRVDPSGEPEPGDAERIAGAGRTAHPSLAPGGARLAWAGGDGTIRVAPVRSEGVGDARAVAHDRAVTGLAWSGDETLIATVLVPIGGGARAELVAIDATSGAEIWRSEGAHAWSARPDPWREGCVLFVRDRGPRGNELARACPEARAEPFETVWAPPAGLRLVELATHPTLGAALAVWGGGETRLAHLPDPGAPPRWLTGGAADVRHPVWTADGRLRVATDVLGVWEIAELRLEAPGAPRAVVALTRSVGGTDQPTAGRFARRLEADGYAIVALTGLADANARLGATEAPSGGAHAPGAPPPPEPPLAPEPPFDRTAADRHEASALARTPGFDVLTHEAGPPPPERSVPGAPGPVRRRLVGDELALYGWLPTAAAWTEAGPVVEVTAFGQDVLGRRGLSVVAGFDPRRLGPLGPWWTYVEGDTDPVASFRTRSAWSAAVRVGSWPYGAHRDSVPSIAAGARLELRTRHPVRLADRVAVVFGHLALDAVALPGRSAPAFGVRAGAGVSSRRGDAWGAPRRGARVEVHVAWQPVAAGGPDASSAAPSDGLSGRSAGVWVEADAHRTFGAVGATELGGTAALHAGWRPALPVPLALERSAAAASVTVRARTPLRLRALDGRFALEALRVEPSLRGWIGGAPGSPVGSEPVAGVGADLGVLVDVVVGYGAPLRIGVRGGRSDRWWIRTELSLPSF